MSSKVDGSDWEERKVAIYGNSNDEEVYYSCQPTGTGKKIYGIWKDQHFGEQHSLLTDAFQKLNTFASEGPQTQSHSAVQKEWRTLLCLKVLCVLTAAGIIALSICYLLLSLENNKMNNSYNQLQTKLSVMMVNNSRLEDEIKQLRDENEDKKCRNGWMRFGCSCYLKSTFTTSWDKSRSDCQNKGSDLVIIDDEEEQGFITKLNQNGESWIGLEVGWSTQKEKYDWKWVDGSQLTEIFEKKEKIEFTDYNTAVYLNAEGKWKSLPKTRHKTFICEI
ncbi:C-type lectin domain family 1 member B isoform X2 [Oryzias latipes]